MKRGDPIFGEESLTKVAAVFPDRQAAMDAAAGVRRSLGLDEAQVRLVTPGDRKVHRKLEPEEKGVMFTAIKSHITLGLAGLVAGAVLWAILYGAGIGAVRNLPVASALIICGFALTFGLMAGGLVTLRPDRDALNMQVIEAIGEDRYALVVHLPRGEDAERAVSLLEEASGQVLRSL